MLARRHRSRTPEGKETALLLWLVILAVCLPTVGFLWFMTRAMTNERAVMRQQVVEIRDLHLTKAHRSVERLLTRLGKAPMPAFRQGDLTEEQRFRRVVGRGLADTVLFLNGNGQPDFPQLATFLDALTLNEDDEKALALMEQVSEKGLLAVLPEFTNQGCQNGRDWQGRLLYPNLQLGALQNLDPASVDHAEIASALKASLGNSQIPWPLTQRLFLVQTLRGLGIPVEFPAEAAFQLAADVLEMPLQLGQSGVLQRSAFPEATWRLLTEDRKFLLVFREASIRNLLVAAANKSSDDDKISFDVFPGASSPETRAIGPSAPGWHVGLSAQSMKAPEGTMFQSRAFTLAVGCMLLAIVGIIATFAIRRFLAHNRITQLRNDFLATISHELKTPLASTRMLVDTLVEGKIDDPDKTQSYLEVIGRENTRLSHLVENFLTYSRLESGRMPFDRQLILPDEIANQALDALESRLDMEQLALEVNIAEELPYVKADEATLTIALVNLLDNAYKYTGEEKAISLNVTAQGENVHFAVGDNGIGLSASERERVRERFFRVDGQGISTMSGSGLGLSIVSDIVAAHQGELLIESLPDQGSVFTLVIPSAGNR